MKSIGIIKNGVKINFNINDNMKYNEYDDTIYIKVNGVWTPWQVAGLAPPIPIGTKYDFTYSGAVEPFTVPASGTWKLEVWGASGGYNGGKGGYSYGNVLLTADDTIYIMIGGQGTSGGSFQQYLTGGYNGGGVTFVGESSRGQGSGGGATHIATRYRGLLSTYNSYRSEILIVAGGGGGGITADSVTYNGGDGGGTSGSDGIGGSTNYNGKGGTQSAGGSSPLPGGFETVVTPVNGGFGYGGYHNLKVQPWESNASYIGGGAGWFGGGGGIYVGAGGGGSGYIGGCISGTTGMENGVQSGNGKATITFIDG